MIKVHQRQRPRQVLAEVARIQNHLSEIGFFAPKVIAGPVPLGNGHAMVEPFIDEPSGRGGAGRDQTDCYLRDGGTEVRICIPPVLNARCAAAR